MFRLIILVRIFLSNSKAHKLKYIKKFDSEEV